MPESDLQLAPGRVKRRHLSAACVLAVLPLVACGTAAPARSPGLFQVGGMRESIGNGRHEGRVRLAEVVDAPHFYGVGALAALRGEITVLDSVAVVTGVTEEGLLRPVEDPGAQATMLAGRSVGEWVETTLAGEVPPERFDDTVAGTAGGQGVDVSEPFVFVVEGAFTDVRLHVINGVCPIQARMGKLDIAEPDRPYELEAAELVGTLVGVYAADSVGKLTHPATSTHAHLVYVDERTGARVTGHVERVGLAAGGVLKLPASGG